MERKIKEALENLSPEYDPTSWDSLEARMNAEEILNPSDDSLIDDLAISSLAGLSVAAGSDWNLFEDKLEASEAAEIAEIDQLAYDNLSRFETPYEPSHWAMMLQKIEAELTLRGKLYRYKVGEVALMLLLIFTFINLQPLDNFPIKLGSKKAKDRVENSTQNQISEPVLNNFIPQVENENKEEKTEKTTQPIAANISSKSKSQQSKASIKPVIIILLRKMGKLLIIK